MGDMLKEISKSDTVDVWCTGCNSWAKMNAAYAAIIKTGEISQCSKCPKN